MGLDSPCVTPAHIVDAYFSADCPHAPALCMEDGRDSGESLGAMPVHMEEASGDDAAPSLPARQLTFPVDRDPTSDSYHTLGGTASTGRFEGVPPQANATFP